MTNKMHSQLSIKLKEEENIPKQIKGSLTLVTGWFSDTNSARIWFGCLYQPHASSWS